MEHDFSNKVVVITGGTGALGKVLTKSFLNCNPKAIISTYRSEKELQELKAEINDLSNPSYKDNHSYRIYKN